MKKIAAWAVVLVFIIFTCSFSAFADDVYSGNMTNEQFEEQYYSLLASYLNGDLSWEDYNTSSNAIIDEYYNDNTVGGEINAGAAKIGRTCQAINEKIGDIAQTYGDKALDKIKEILGNSLAPFYTVTTEKSANPYTHFSGAPDDATAILVRRWYADGNNFFESTWYGTAPGELYTQGDHINFWLPYNYSTCSKDGEIYVTSDNVTSISGEKTEEYFLYGNWIWREDGTSADTDDTYETADNYDFSQADEDELVDLLNKILEELENENPDLDTDEDTLKAIYYKLKKMEDDQISKDELEQIINSAIDKLNAHECDHSEIVALLEEIRDNNEDYNKDWIEEYRKKILAYLYPGEEELTEAQEFATDVKGLFLTKFGFIEEFKDFFSNLKWGSDTSFSLDLTFNGNSYPMEPSGLEELAEIVRYMLAFFIYGSFAIRSYKRMPEIIATGGGDE